jgi:hypothetical protein
VQGSPPDKAGSDFVFQYYFSIKKESVPKANMLAKCGNATFKIWRDHIYPQTDRHEFVRY